MVEPSNRWFNFNMYYIITYVTVIQLINTNSLIQSDVIIWGFIIIHYCILQSYVLIFKKHKQKQQFLT